MEALPVTSYISTQSWTEHDVDKEGNRHSSNYQRSPIGTFVDAEPDENLEVWPETGRPGPEVTAYIVTVLEYDPKEKKLSRQTATVTRAQEMYGTLEDSIRALEAANEIDEEMWKMLGESQQEGWLATCLTEGNTEALWKNYESEQDCFDAIEPAKGMDDSIRSGLGDSERDKDGWLATCFKEENAEALRSKQDELFEELKGEPQKTFSPEGLSAALDAVKEASLTSTPAPALSQDGDIIVIDSDDDAPPKEKKAKATRKSKSKGSGYDDVDTVFTRTEERDEDGRLVKISVCSVCSKPNKPRVLRGDLSSLRAHIMTSKDHLLKYKEGCENENIDMATRVAKRVEVDYLGMGLEAL
ncbi:hypothetical protein L198_02912 [Cryptococcus wingfieldii CBS 7118]|uniref:Uncharacterized protein n=1 Tax=Cryptococcus wingfieldii CBS 7118 TaxID=1295528 RepID=A0A1E3JKY6_9TREE|nr:hypothetical protein L198_02912 [Cryptococcus wingfieldii CBS 7118]ODO00592.1 hypothetical protein L198_02912 [Cryptococcus wingfieldii CBS 7118]